MGEWYFFSISMSESRNVNPNILAANCPTAVLPVPIKPIRYRFGREVHCVSWFILGSKKIMISACESRKE